MQVKQSQAAQASVSEAKEEQKIAAEISPIKPLTFPIVGIGFSAGGLEALFQLFSAMPEKTGMGFVIAQHADPNQPSILPDLLQRQTQLKVEEARDGMEIEPDHVYIPSSDKNVQLTGQTLRLSQKPERPYVAHSIDLFFRSLAEELKDKAIGIVLSGMGSDGTFGARLINRKLGMVIAQEPTTANFPDMPSSVVEIGVADFVLPPQKMPESLMQYARYYFGKTPEEREKALRENPQNLRKIFDLFKQQTKADLSQFKLATIYRRIQRRMGIRQVGNIEVYIRLLKDDPEEAGALFKEFLINVTRFFQNPLAYDSLKQYLIQFLKYKSENETVKAWTLGCSTGEETYSFAMLIQECLDELKMKTNFKVFATDLDKSAINLAHTGLYPAGIVNEDVGEERISKFFQKRDSYYQVNKSLRQNVVFSILDFISTPSFYGIDLVSSRSILVYLNASAHRRIIPVLYNALNPHGLLFLGAKDSMERFTQLFQPLNKTYSIYQRR